MPGPPSPVAARPLIGRTAEIARLAALLDTPEPAGRYAVVHGEPGIGKSRLITEFARLAAARGQLVLTGRATEFERTVPYGIVLDAASAAPDDHGDLDALFDTLSAPQLPRHGRHRHHRRVRGLFATLARRTGIVLILDDVHWADDASDDLLAYVLRHPPHGPVTAVLAFRSGQCPPRLADALAHLPVPVTTLPLRPLNADDVAGLLPAEPPGRRRMLHQLSAGNPLCLISRHQIRRTDRGHHRPDDQRGVTGPGDRREQRRTQATAAHRHGPDVTSGAHEPELIQRAHDVLDVQPLAVLPEIPVGGVLRRHAGLDPPDHLGAVRGG
ncbi:AAA family ATPase, partial [Actinoplanes couchii]|uniref:AAA family ATPase n=1 Tax=Actinoplanes couchii TaxID=403638 RepID=UPI001943BD23